MIAAMSYPVTHNIEANSVYSGNTSKPPCGEFEMEKEIRTALTARFVVFALNLGGRRLTDAW